MYGLELELLTSINGTIFKNCHNFLDSAIHSPSKSPALPIVLEFSFFIRQFFGINISEVSALLLKCYCLGDS